jgi:hypothetical protein
VELISGAETFSLADLEALSDHVAAAWTEGRDADWGAPAGTLEWSCLRTADHAVDCVFAPAFFLASRKTDAYPIAGADLTLGDDATPARLVEALGVAVRLLAAVVRDASPDDRAIIFSGPTPVTGAPRDFVPRAALELVLHAHDVCLGLGVTFEPDRELCSRLREHTRPWPLWTAFWSGLPRTDDPWRDLLTATERRRGRSYIGPSATSSVVSSTTSPSQDQ